ALGLLDLTRAPSQRTHLGRLFERIGSQSSGGLTSHFPQARRQPRDALQLLVADHDHSDRTALALRLAARAGTVRRARGAATGTAGRHQRRGGQGESPVTGTRARRNRSITSASEVWVKSSYHTPTA